MSRKSVATLAASVVLCGFLVLLIHEGVEWEGAAGSRPRAQRKFAGSEIGQGEPKPRPLAEIRRLQPGGLPGSLASTIQVRASDGEALPDASLRPVQSSQRFDAEGLAGIDADSNGVIRVPWVAETKEQEFMVSAPGYVAEYIEGIEGGASYVVELDRGGALVVNVRTPQGEPVHDALIAVSASKIPVRLLPGLRSGGARPGGRYYPVFSEATNEDGEATMLGLPRGSYYVYCWHEFYFAPFVDLDQTMEVFQEEHEVDIEVWPLLAVVGKVVCEQEGEAVYAPAYGSMQARLGRRYPLSSEYVFPVARDRLRSAYPEADVIDVFSHCDPDSLDPRELIMPAEVIMREFSICKAEFHGRRIEGIREMELVYPGHEISGSPGRGSLKLIARYEESMEEVRLDYVGLCRLEDRRSVPMEIETGAEVSCPAGAMRLFPRDKYVRSVIGDRKFQIVPSESRTEVVELNRDYRLVRIRIEMPSSHFGVSGVMRLEGPEGVQVLPAREEVLMLLRRGAWSASVSVEGFAESARSFAVGEAGMQVIDIVVGPGA